MARRGVAAGAVLVVLSTGCGSRAPAPHALPLPSPSAVVSSPSPSPAPTSAPVVHAHAAVAPLLVPYSSCPDMLRRIKREALKEVTAYGLGIGPVAYAVGLPAMAAATPMGASAGATTGAGVSAQAPVASTTNNQEAGVDEPDIVKTDGARMVVMRNEPLGVQVVDVSTEHPRLRGFLRLDHLLWEAQLLDAGRYVVAIGSGVQDASTGSNTTGVVVLDVSDLDHPRVVRSFHVDGLAASSRYVDGHVVVALQDQPRLTFVQPTSGSAKATTQALRENRRRVRATTLSSWLPTVTADRTGRHARSGCRSSYRPTTDSGLGTTTVLSLDPTTDEPGHLVSVVGNAGTVYASPTSLYVAMTSWESQQALSLGATSAARTQLHAFALGSGNPSYLGSGTVPGSLLNQYALSEHDGVLRVATTVGDPLPPPNEGTPPKVPSDNLVTTLRPSDGALVKVGQLRGLGRGERIFGVRFVDDLGYVVTFRQTDPLFVLDLHDPARPALRGELKVTGYSAYLHPLGDGLLFGLGQSVDARLRRNGTQASVFDVGDVRHPSLRSRLGFSEMTSAAEDDPHAFLWWAPTRTVVVPLSRYDGSEAFEGVLVLHVDGAGVLHEQGRLEQPADTSEPDGQPGSTMMPVRTNIARTVVVGDLLFTLSSTGVMANRLDGLQRQAWLPYA